VNSVVKTKLHTDQEQREALLSAMLLFSEVCNRVSVLAFEKGKLKNKTRLQKAVYHQVKEEIPEAGSQIIIRSISKVATSYQVSTPAQERANKRREKKGLKLIEFKPNFFKATSSIDYDLRMMSFLPNGRISLWTPEGRIQIEYTVPRYFQQRLADGKPAMAQLILKNGTFWLHLSVKEQCEELKAPSDFLGVDQGQVYIASDSDGKQYEGATLKKKSERYKERRESLRQSIDEKKTRSKERAWNKFSKKESRFRADVNHRISKEIVQKAKNSNSCIVLENLQDFFHDIRVRRENRFQRRSWGFAQLLSFIQYKAERHGVEVRLVNPAYTSQECSACGNIDSKSRKDQATFVCTKCRHSENADINAAKVIRNRGICQLSHSSAANAA